MRAHLRRFLFIIMAMMLLTVTAFADFGPKPQLVVKVKNPPEELYYLDLLAEGSAADLYATLTEKEKAWLDPALYDTLVAAIPEGWHACVAQGTGGAPIWGDLTGENGIHTFGYHGVPRTYRILIVTKSGETWVSEPHTRTILQSSVTVNWASKTVYSPPAFVGYLLQFLSTFVPTILLEGILLGLFGMVSTRNLSRFLLVNFLTQGILAVYCSITFLQQGFNTLMLAPFVMIECLITVAELILYRRCFPEFSLKRVFSYTISANTLSAAAGWFLAEPVWRFVVSIS